MGVGIWWACEIPGPETSVEFNFNEEAEQESLNSGTTYNWRIEVRDSNGNEASLGSLEFTPQLTACRRTKRGLWAPFILYAPLLTYSRGDLVCPDHASQRYSQKNAAYTRYFQDPLPFLPFRYERTRDSRSLHASSVTV